MTSISFESFYNIPTNVISLDTVDLTECDPMLRITTLWFYESISPLSETDVHYVFINTQCLMYFDVIHVAPYKICTKYLKPTKPTPKHERLFFFFFALKMIFQLKTSLRVYSTQRKKLTTILLKCVFL